MNNIQNRISNNVETLLYNYNYYKTRIKSLKKKIEELMNGGELISSNVDYENVKFTHIYKSDVDKRMEKINYHTKEMLKYESLIDILDYNLNDLMRDKYYDVIRLKYFEKKTVEEISFDLGIGISTVKRNKKRLIKELSDRLLPLYI